jgi:hypothetical protein
MTRRKKSPFLSSVFIKPSAHSFEHQTAITCLPNKLEQRLKQHVCRNHSALHSVLKKIYLKHASAGGLVKQQCLRHH